METSELTVQAAFGGSESKDAPTPHTSPNWLPDAFRVAGQAHHREPAHAREVPSTVDPSCGEYIMSGPGSKATPRARRGSVVVLQGAIASPPAQDGDGSHHVVEFSQHDPRRPIPPRNPRPLAAP